MARDRPEHVAASPAAAARPRPSRAPARSLSPSPRSSCWSFAQSGTLSPGFGSVRPAVSAGESTVGIQTIRAPSRAAISTASAFIPPTARLSVIVPITSHARDDAGDDLRALGGGRVVRLEPEAGEPDLGEAAGERDVVDPARRARRARRGRAGRTRRARASRARSLGWCSHRRLLSLSRRELGEQLAALAVAIRGSTPSSSSRSRAASISSTRRAACARLPSSRRSSSGRPITAAISLLQPLGVARSLGAPGGSRSRRRRGPS